MRPISVFEASGTTSIALWISTARPWTFSAPRSQHCSRTGVFPQSIDYHLPRWPRKVTLDGYRPSHQALRLLRREDPKWKYVMVRSCQYLNNIIEQDHRAIKRRCSWMTGFKSDRNAAITLSGIELAHRIRKRQFSFGPGGQRRLWSLKQFWDWALAQKATITACQPAVARHPRMHQNPGAYDAFDRCADQGLIFASFLASAARARRVS